MWWCILNIKQNIFFMFWFLARECNPKCQNRGVCAPDPNDPSHLICFCLPGYYGTACENSKVTSAMDRNKVVVVVPVLPKYSSFNMSVLCRMVLVILTFSITVKWQLTSVFYNTCYASHSLWMLLMHIWPLIICFRLNVRRERSCPFQIWKWWWLHISSNAKIILKTNVI